MADKDLQADRSSIFDIVARADLVSLTQALSTEQVDIEARDPAGRTALHIAVLAATADVCQHLIDHGANVDTWTRQGEAVVHLAARRGEVDILRTVMESVEAKQRAIQSENKPDEKAEGSRKGGRSVHVNSLTQKHQMSPLYIAVALGTLKEYSHMFNLR